MTSVIIDSNRVKPIEDLLFKKMNIEYRTWNFEL